MFDPHAFWAVGTEDGTVRERFFTLGYLQDQLLRVVDGIRIYQRFDSRPKTSGDG